MAGADTAGPSTSTDPHRMRITSGGQIAGYVNFALSFLKENPHRSLVLHTLPPDTSAQAETSTAGFNSTLLVTPKLVSVVEKIKRDYMAHINGSSEGKGKNKAVGIWQYNESGVLPGPAQEELGLETILQGRSKPKMTHRPYLQITLSTRPLGLEEGTKGRDVTCQYVMVRRRKSKPVKQKQAASKSSPKAAEGEAGAKEATAATISGQDEKAAKRKAENSQASDTGRGGKKRKK